MLVTGNLDNLVYFAASAAALVVAIVAQPARGVVSRELSGRGFESATRLLYIY
jgi:hypothetical protein